MHGAVTCMQPAQLLDTELSSSRTRAHECTPTSLRASAAGNAGSKTVAQMPTMLSNCTSSRLTKTRPELQGRMHGDTKKILQIVWPSQLAGDCSRLPQPGSLSSHYMFACVLGTTALTDLNLCTRHTFDHPPHAARLPALLQCPPERCCNCPACRHPQKQTRQPTCPSVNAALSRRATGAAVCRQSHCIWSNPQDLR